MVQFDLLVYLVVMGVFVCYALGFIVEFANIKALRKHQKKFFIAGFALNVYGAYLIFFAQF